MACRELARAKQGLTHQECIDILSDEKRGVLAVLGDDGYPYALPINHYYNPEDGKIYFHSGRKGHKIDAMRRDGRVSFTVMDSGTPSDTLGWALGFRSVIVFGRIEFIEDRDAIYDIARKLSRKFTQDEKYIEREIARSGPATLMFALVPEHICGKRVKEE